MSSGELADRHLAASALRKRAIAERPTREEAAALRRIEKQREATERSRHYKSIAPREYRQMSGCSDKVRLEQAERYRLPLQGPEINLYELLPAVHRLLADISRGKFRLAAGDAPDPLLTGANSPALEEYRRERTKLVRLERKSKERMLVDRETMHSVLAIVASRFRRAGDQLQKHFGPDAHKILEEAIDDAERETLRLFADPDDSSGDEPDSRDKG